MRAGQLSFLRRRRRVIFLTVAIASRLSSLDIRRRPFSGACPARFRKWSGRLDSNQRPPHPQCDALPGCATPRLGRAHLGRASTQGKVRSGNRVARRRRKGKSGKWVGRALSALLAIPALYLVAALIGSLLPVNRGWSEPHQRTTVYLADNGVHFDIVMPVSAQGLDWRPLIRPSDF